MEGCVDEWMVGWMEDGWWDLRMVGWTDGRMDGWMSGGLLERWMDD
jgi:hypothetical protein